MPVLSGLPMIGKLVDGKYQIVRILGEGGMGAVYEALHTGTGRHVALKVIVSADLAKNQDMVSRFQREAKAAGAIDTQHIVQVLDAGRDPATGFPFMVMELLSGEDLQQLILRVGPLPPDLALRIVAQACIGLQKAHDAQVVHRDIKPANLFLARRDAGEVVVKVLDFGIAKVKADPSATKEDHGLTRTGAMLGSPSYMSPEQAKGLKGIDHRTDLWSLGAVLYEAMSGVTPHHTAETLGQLILAICSAPPPALQEVAPWVPAEVAAIVHGALQLDVEKRLPTAQAILDAIRSCVPDGIALTESMLVGVDPQQRALVAPKLAMSVITDGLTASGLSRATSVPGATAGIPLHTGSGQTFAQPPAAHAPRRSAAVAVVGALMVLGVGGVAVVKLARSRPAPSAEAVPAAVSEAPAEAPAAAVSEAPSVAPAAPELGARTVKVVIVPRNASVELDGAAAATKDGVLDVSGTLGSVHPVRVFVGARETTGDIVIAEGGAIPPKVELGTAIAAPSKPGAPKTSAPAVGPAATPAAAPARPTAAPAGAARTFE